MAGINLQAWLEVMVMYVIVYDPANRKGRLLLKGHQIQKPYTQVHHSNLY